jgi:hypothetical protein
LDVSGTPSVLIQRFLTNTTNASVGGAAAADDGDELEGGGEEVAGRATIMSSFSFVPKPPRSRRKAQR